MSLYGEPNSPARLAMLRAKQAMLNAPKGLERFQAIQAYERARAAAIKAARESKATRELDATIARWEASTPTQQIVSQLVSALNHDDYSHYSTSSGQIEAKHSAKIAREDAKNAISYDLFSSGVQGVYPFSSSYREIAKETPESTKLFGKPSRGVCNENSPRKALKRPRHRADRRFALGRPQECSRGEWTARVCAELDRLGWVYTSQALETCGHKARTWDCGGCGERNAAIEVATTCGLRICPWCGRRDSQKRVKRLVPAIDLVEHFTDCIRLKKQAEIERVESRAKSSFAFWMDKYRRARNQNSALFCAQKAAKAAEREKVAEYHKHRAKDPRWSWKLFTVTPQWNPNSMESYTIQGLRDRVRDVRARWLRIWRWIGVRGMASATVTTEISENAHIHLHALVFCPHVSDLYIRELAGCGVQIKEASGGDGAAKEIAKYSAKLISPLSGQWIAGERRRVIHPTTAARWMLATRKTQIKWNHGQPLRQSLRETKPEPCEVQAPKCVSCKADLLDDSREVLVADIAREQYQRAESILAHTRKLRTVARIEGMSASAIDAAFPCDDKHRVLLRRHFWAARLRLIQAKRTRR